MDFVHGESVHSWIYRILTVFGETTFNSIVGTNGKWISSPIIPRKFSSISKGFSDIDLLYFMRDSGLAINEAGIFDNPIKYLSSVERFFDDNLIEERNEKGKISIKYCDECIEDAIFELGFGYLKADWLYGSMCQIHGKNLNQIKVNSRSQALTLLKSILAGKKVPEKKLELPVTYSKHLSERGNFEYHVMPCLLHDFYRWASWRRKDDYLDGSHHEFYDSRFMRRNISDYKLHNYFLVYEVKYSVQFSSFLSETSEIIEYKYGFNQKLSLKENLLKSRKHNCSKCLMSQHHCPINLIARFRIEEVKESHRSVDLNICDFFLRYGKLIPLHRTST